MTDDAEEHLLQQLEIASRLYRVDTALARRVSEMMQREATLRVHLRQWLDCYATDIFPEPDLAKATEVLKANGMTIDSLSAHMGRHVLTRVLELMAKNDDD